jgi:hypothetical protein
MLGATLPQPVFQSPESAHLSAPDQAEAPKLKRAESAGADSVPPSRPSQSRSVIAVPEEHYLERDEQARPWCPEIAVRYSAPFNSSAERSRSSKSQT